DDFLYAGGALDDLVVLHREVPAFSLALYADEEGIVSGSPRALAGVLGVGKDEERVVAELSRYIKQGWISANRDLALDRNRHSGTLTWVGANSDEWPQFTVSEAHRYTQDLVRLGDYLPYLEHARADVFELELWKAQKRNVGA